MCDVIPGIAMPGHRNAWDVQALMAVSHRKEEVHIMARWPLPAFGHGSALRRRGSIQPGRLRTIAALKFAGTCCAHGLHGWMHYLQPLLICLHMLHETENS